MLLKVSQLFYPNCLLLLKDDAKEAVDDLVKTVCTTTPSIKSSLELKNTTSSSLAISSEQVKLICQQVRELFNDLSSFRTELRSMDTILHSHIKKLEEDMLAMKAEHDESMKAMKSKHETDIAKVKEKVNDNDQLLLLLLVLSVVVYNNWHSSKMMKLIR